MIEPKDKKCKGTGQAHGFGCGKMTKHRVYGLCKSGCYPEWLFNSDAGKVKLGKAISKAQKPRKELEELRTQTKSRNTLSKEIDKTQRVVNKYIRLRDQGKPCVSQNIPYTKDQEAGHLYSKKQYSAIRFDYDNLHGQSIYANRFLEGDFANYLINVESRIGKERLYILKLKAEECKRSTKKWTFNELKEIQEDAKNRIKQL